MPAGNGEHVEQDDHDKDKTARSLKASIFLAAVLPSLHDQYPISTQRGKITIQESPNI